MPIRIAVVDDHTLVREGLRGIVQLEPDMDVHFECDTFEKAKDFLEGAPLIDVIIIDIILGDETGFSLIKLAKLNKIKCIAVSMHGTEPYISEAMSAGACGYISKDSAATDLIAGIRAVSENKIYYSKDIKHYLSISPEENPFSELTEREVEVCLHIINGYRVKAIAKELDISPKTIYVHKANAYISLRINSTRELFQLVKKHGFVSWWPGKLYLDSWNTRRITPALFEDPSTLIHQLFTPGVLKYPNDPLLLHR